MKSTYLLAISIAFCLAALGCVEDAQSVDDDEKQVLDAPPVSIKEAVAAAPECNAINQDKIYYHEDTEVFVMCNQGSWNYFDLDAHLSKSIGVYSSFWTAYNPFDADVFVTCGFSGSRPGVITGVQSKHHNHYEDRRFSYKCSFIYDY